MALIKCSGGATVLGNGITVFNGLCGKMFNENYYTTVNGLSKEPNSKLVSGTGVYSNYITVDGIQFGYNGYSSGNFYPKMTPHVAGTLYNATDDSVVLTWSEADKETQKDINISGDNSTLNLYFVSD